MALDIHFLYQETSERVEALNYLLNELIGLVGVEAVASLKAVVVCAATDLPAVVNGLIEGTSQAHYTPNPAHLPSGVAVPIERDDTYFSVIVLCQDVLQPLTSEYRSEPNTVSTVLEELLHVWIYESAWARRGYIQHHRQGVLACEADLIACAQQMCDEYCAIRRKADLLSTHALVESAPGAGRTTVGLSYGAAPADAIGIGAGEIRSTIREASDGSYSTADSWAKLIRLLYRRIFEPLARHAAYTDSSGDKSLLEAELRSIDFYREVVDEHWVSIRTGLDVVFTSQLASTEAFVQEAASSMRSMLSTLGVEYRRTVDGQCWVEFRAG